MHTPLATMAALIAALAIAQADTEIYDLKKSNTGKGNPWSGDNLQVKLSPGEDGGLQFKLGDLPDHKYLRLQIEVQIGSGGMGAFGNVIVHGMNQGGEKKTEADERLKITTSSGQTLLDSSFSSMHLAQSFPDNFGAFNHAPGTGSAPAENKAGKNAMMQVFGDGAGSTGIYKIDLLFPHEGPGLDVKFDWLKPEVAGGLQGMIIQQMGGMFGEKPSPYTVTGLTLTTAEAAPELDEKSANELLDKIASDKPKAAHAAMKRIIAAGDSALPFIRARFAIKPDPNLEENFKAAAKGLRSDAFRERAKAEADLIKMGPDVLPHIIATLTGDGSEKLTPDYRVGLEKVKKRLQQGAKASSNQALANRLHHALALFKSEEAKKTVAALPPVKKLKRYVTPDKPKGFGGGDFEFDFDVDELPIPEE